MVRRIFQLISVAFVSLLVFSCEDDTVYTGSDARLEFSTDTVMFDTVFSTLGSTTKRLKVYNPLDKPVEITSVKVAGGTLSPFVVNINGLTDTASNFRIEAHDSMYVFVQVKVDPTGQNSPLVLEDSLVFKTNNHLQKVKLFVWGQDIHLLNDSVVGTQTWTADKPYVIYKALLVDSLATLTINPGTTIYMHRGVWFGVKGTLIVNGTKENPVIFRGDRMDVSNYAPPVPYDEIPGQWEEIRFMNGSKGKLNYAIIRNGQFGLVAGVLDKEEKAELEMSNCKIYNHAIVSLFTINAKVKAYNSLIANGGYASFMCSPGGEYEFYHCTFANYPSFGVSGGSAVVLMNYAAQSDTTSSNAYAKKYYYEDLTKAYFGNCLIFSENAKSLVLEFSDKKAANYLFDHCLIKYPKNGLNLSDETKFLTTKVSDKTEPGFVKVDVTNYKYDFQLTRTSIAREIGSIDVANLYPVDLIENSRVADEMPDAGCYEYVAPAEKK